MKKFIFTLLILLVIPMGLCAQQDARTQGNHVRHDGHPHFDFEQYLSQKCDAVVREMGLSSADSIKFVPVYCELQQQKSQLFRKYGGGRKVRRALERGEQVADTTLMRVINNQAKLQAEDAQLEQRFIERFAQVLTPIQLYKLQLAEQKFKTDMMKRSNPNRK